MTADTKIEWTDHTFNPWWGCVKVSPGCKHCYAEGITARFRPEENIWGPAATTDRSPMSDDYWRQPAKWNRAAEKSGEPAFVFCASMADVFEDHPQVHRWRDRLWTVIQETPWLTWQLLTKRPENVAPFVPASWLTGRWPANVWIGTSVEDQQRAVERIPFLLDIPSSVRFLSVEPLIGPVDISPFVSGYCPEHDFPGGFCLERYHPGVQHIDWVIVGGESGPGARPMRPGLVRSVRDQCAAADVPFFFKQWGAHDEDGRRVGKHLAGRTLDGLTHDDRPPAHRPQAVLL